MRKITSQKDKEKKNKRNKTILGVLLVFVMFASVLGYSFQGRENKTDSSIEYNNLKFNQNGDYWISKISDYQFVFKNNPKQVDRIDSEINYVNNYVDSPLYISSEDKESETEIYNNLVYYNEIVLRIQEACLEGYECEENIPVKNCSNNFIIIQESEKTELIQDENCVFIKGPKEELIQITDEFLFKILGIT